MPPAAAAKSLQSCLTLCDPIDGSPPGSPVLGIFQARTLEWVAISFSNAWKWKVKAKSLSHVRLFATPWTTAYQAPQSMGFSRQEYWSGVPLPSPSPAYHPHNQGQSWVEYRGRKGLGQGHWQELRSRIQWPLTSSRQAVKLCKFQSSCHLFHRMVSEVSVNSNGSIVLQVYKRKLKNNFLNSLVFLLGIFFWQFYKPY